MCISVFTFNDILCELRAFGSVIVPSSFVAGFVEFCANCGAYVNGGALIKKNGVMFQVLYI